jgi:proteasome assembly chaperone (PAC2) family protein
MKHESIEIDHLPRLTNPLLIAGFDGWGNALDISSKMTEYLIRKLEARRFARFNPDPFYRFDEKRPVVDIENGVLKDISQPGGAFYATRPGHLGRDLIILNASEPSLHWFRFVDSILSLCAETGVKRLISLGSMYDNVLHTETLISALASSAPLLEILKERKVRTISYKGPSAIHSTLHAEARNRGVECISLWCHCPYYLQGTTHFGLLAYLGSLLSSLEGFDLDTEELENTWKELSRQIQQIVDRNPELQVMINDLRKAKVKGSWGSAKRHDKVIQLEDFLKPR